MRNQQVSDKVVSVEINRIKSLESSPNKFSTIKSYLESDEDFDKNGINTNSQQALPLF